jgi:hypothetical protein
LSKEPAVAFALTVARSPPEENKGEIRGVFFNTQKHAVIAPRLPRIPPQLHHKNTTPKTRIFPKHPSKTPANRQQRPTPPRQFFSYKI